MWFPAADWCIYKRAIRTNNDVKGWHNRLNTRAHHSNISFYILVSLLHPESRLVPSLDSVCSKDTSNNSFTSTNSTIDNTIQVRKRPIFCQSKAVFGCRFLLLTRLHKQKD